jgi:hypothetical protein
VGERKPRNQILYGKLPRDVEDELSPVHMKKIWELLETKFCFNLKVWKKDFQEYFQKQPHMVTEREAFVEFGVKHIQPVLNMVLGRKEYHPTWRNLLAYIVKKF